MKCRNIDNLMDAYLDGELSQVQQTQVESHLAECSACREEVDAMRRSIQALTAPKRQFDPPDILSAVKREVADRPTRWMPTYFGWSAAAAAVLLIAIFGWRSISTRRQVDTHITASIPLETPHVAAQENHCEMPILPHVSGVHGLSRGIGMPARKHHRNQVAHKDRPNPSAVGKHTVAVPEAEYVIVCMPEEPAATPVMCMKADIAEASLQAAPRMSRSLTLAADALPNITQAEQEKSSYSIHMTNHETGEITGLSVQREMKSDSDMDGLTNDTSVTNGDDSKEQVKER